jgi:two-component system sensor histidine kinase KdpD
MADTYLLRRSLVNLVANALRFSPEGSTITLESYMAPDDDGIILVVEDMGPGVAPADRKRIFLPFTQAKGEEHRGTGLGLAFCREVALIHGGYIWVEDRKGGGSRFCMFLPTQQNNG